MNAIAINNQSHAAVRDVSGYAVFAAGEVGVAHVAAHAAVDSGNLETGRRELGAFLDSHTGSGSDWAHLHFHMALFELAANDWDAAYRRFRSEILPLATESQEALTDAPGLLWRLALTAPRPLQLPWAPVRDTALMSLGESDPFVEMHNLLALAGAGDATSILAWLRTASELAPSADRKVRQFAVALLRYVRGDLALAADMLDDLIPSLGEIGGSHAQNQLFYMLRDRCLNEGTPPPSTYREAA